MAAALDLLIDRFIQLIKAKKEAKAELFDNAVAPVAAAFEAVHAEYLASFARYRETLKSSKEPLKPGHPLLDTIRTDNLFKEHQRTRLLQLGEGVGNSEVAPFAKAIQAYLMDARVAEDPIGGYRGGQFRNPQRWRRTLLAEIECIFEERWLSVLDPDCAAPPLRGEALAQALEAECRNAGIPKRDRRRMDRLKAHLAVKALDEVVGEMQAAYAQTSEELLRLSRTLKA